MQMRASLGCLFFLAGGLLPAPAQGYSPAVESLGNPTLVLEDKTTVLSLWNLGNPAAGAFLPPENQLDAALEFGHRRRAWEFQTGEAGTSLALDAAGNTLLPLTVYEEKNYRWFSGLSRWENTGWGGWQTWLAPGGMLQILPLGEYATYDLSGAAQKSFRGQGGVKLRTAWKLSNQLALGAGLQAEAQTATNLEAFSETDPWANTLAGFSAQGTALLTETGAVWRIASLFEDLDFLDTGIFLQTAWEQEQISQTGAGNLAGQNQVWHTRRLPFQLQWQNVYSFKNLMEAGFVLAYLTEKQYLSLDGDAVSYPERMIADLSKLDYSLSFRVRLPLVREDDLRFGVTFDNRGHNHPQPTGSLRTYALDGQTAQPVINTSSSTIAIGMAYVPGEGSVITLQYGLSSSKSRQENEIKADSGGAQFSLGTQVRLSEALYLRGGFTNDQTSYYSRAPSPVTTTASDTILVTKGVETSSYRLGVGWDQGAWQADLTLIYAFVQYSPKGWPLPLKPVALTDVDRDTDTAMKVLLGWHWQW